MRTSQPKKLQINHPRPIRLKFDNIRNEQQLNASTLDDSPQLDKLLRAIEDSIKTGHPLSKDIMVENLELVKKLRKGAETPDHPDANKMRFRIVKSAKKNGNESRRTEQDGDVLKQSLPLNPTGENRSQVIAGRQKQNAGCFDQNRSSFYGKIKLKKINQNKRLQIGASCEFRTVSNEEIIIKMREQLKKVTVGFEQKSKQALSYAQRIKFLQEQNKQLKQKLSQKDGEEPLQIDIRYSFKLMEDQQQLQPSPQCEPSPQPLPSAHPQLEQPACHNPQVISAHQQQLISNLQFIVVSQNKQIQSLQDRIVQMQPTPAKKLGSRWQSTY